MSGSYEYPSRRSATGSNSNSNSNHLNNSGSTFGQAVLSTSPENDDPDDSLKRRQLEFKSSMQDILVSRGTEGPAKEEANESVCGVIV